MNSLNHLQYCLFCKNYWVLYPKLLDGNQSRSMRLKVWFAQSRKEIISLKIGKKFHKSFVSQILCNYMFNSIINGDQFVHTKYEDDLLLVFVKKNCLLCVVKNSARKNNAICRGGTATTHNSIGLSTASVVNFFFFI